METYEVPLAFLCIDISGYTWSERKLTAPKCGFKVLKKYYQGSGARRRRDKKKIIWQMFIIYL